MINIENKYADVNAEKERSELEMCLPKKIWCAFRSAVAMYRLTDKLHFVE